MLVKGSKTNSVPTKHYSARHENSWQKGFDFASGKWKTDFVNEFNPLAFKGKKWERIINQPEGGIIRGICFEIDRNNLPDPDVTIGEYGLHVKWSTRVKLSELVEV